MANHKKRRAAKHMNKGHWLCKPWKHGYEPKYRVSERRHLQEPVR